MMINKRGIAGGWGYKYESVDMGEFADNTTQFALD